MRRLFPVLVSVLLLTACATKPGSKTGSSSSTSDIFALPAQPIIGRILSADTQRHTAMVALNPEGMAIPRAEHWPLVSQRDDLTTTARLAGTVHRMGSTLGVIIVEGFPAPGEAVALAPSAPSSPTETP